jgi:hypothetical protein
MVWAFETKSVGLVSPVIKGEISREREREREGERERERESDFQRQRERERITAILMPRISCYKTEELMIY